MATALPLGRELFLQWQTALGVVLANCERCRLLRALRRVCGLQVPLLQRTQGLPVLVSCHRRPPAVGPPPKAMTCRRVWELPWEMLTSRWRDRAGR